MESYSDLYPESVTVSLDVYTDLYPAGALDTYTDLYPGGGPIGTGEFSGVGTLTGSGYQSYSGTASFSGTGTLSGQATAQAITVTAALTGTGSLSGYGDAVEQDSGAGTGIISGVGSLIGTGSVSEVVNTGVLSGSGDITGSGNPSGLSGAATFSGIGNLSGSGYSTGTTETVVIARDEVTLATITDVQSMRRYYLLAATAPTVPTTNPPTGGWTTTEPAYTAGSTGSLYVTDLVVFSDGTFDYLPVQRNSSYEAAKLAYDKAAEAQASSDANYQAMLSRGENLVTNGTGYMGDNTNFTAFIYNKPLAPEGLAGVFLTPGGSAGRTANEIIPIRLGATYNFSYQIRETTEGNTSKYYSFIQPFDAYGIQISPQHYMFVPDTTTTLTQELKPGDTVIKVADPANWYGTSSRNAGAATYLRSMIAWNYVDPGGKSWDTHTYSRNHSGFNRWADGGIAADGTITLSDPWPSANGTIPAGTVVSNGSSGGAYAYRESSVNINYSDGWVLKAGNWKLNPAPAVTAVQGRTAATFGGGWMPPGMAQIKIGWLTNYTGSDAGSKQAFGGVLFSEAAAANVSIDETNSTISQLSEDLSELSNKEYIIYSANAPAGNADALWIDTDTGQPHRWDGATWVLITDSRITEAAQNAQEAMDLASHGGVQQVIISSEPPLGEPHPNEVRTGIYDLTGTALRTGVYSLADITETRTGVYTVAGIESSQDATLWIDSDTGISHRWDGSSWIPVDDARIDAINAELEVVRTSANGKNSIITSTDPASGSINPNTGLSLVRGDLWNQIDNPSTQHIIASWYWDGFIWVALQIKSEFIHNLDVHKLTATTARIQQAVIEKLVADLGYFGTIVTDELIAQQIAVAIADIVEARIENLTVTESATIAQAVIIKLAAALITTGELQTDIDPDTKLQSVLDSNGYRLLDMEFPEEPQEVVRLGPSGNNLLQIGAVTIDHSGGVAGQTGSFKELFVDGTPIVGTVSTEASRGIISWGHLFGGYGRNVRAREQVVGLEVMLQPGRVYRMYTNNPTVETENVNVIPFLQMHRTLDGTWPGDNWGASCVGESIIGPYGGFRTLPGMSRFIDLSRETEPRFLRACISLAEYGADGWCRVAAPVNPCTLIVEDVGSSLGAEGGGNYDAGGGGQAPIRQRTVQRWNPTGWANYIYGGSRDMSRTNPTQGTYASANRECMFFFDDMTATLAGKTIHRITLHARADHWYYGGGGTGRWHWHSYFGSIPESGQFQHIMTDTGGWQRNAVREINLIPSEFAAWQSGARRGFGFSSGDASPEYYGYFSSNMGEHWVEVDYEG